jgi:CheY-like chemotaxis protein
MQRILVVDDQPDIRRLLRATLAKNYLISEAEDGVQALKAIEQDRPKLVLLDVMMPGEIDGLQVLAAIKGNPHTSDILVAILSARGQALDQDEAKKRGADAYFIKPFSPKLVRSWIDRKLKCINA